jgi:citrate synthase
MSSSDSKQSNAWSTGITNIAPNRVAVRGYNIAELMGRVTFGQAVYLILRGELPGDEIGRLMDAMIVSSIDHGATPPSVLAARTVASTGASLSQSVATGIQSINQFHGGAITTCAQQLRELLQYAGQTGLDVDVAASTFLAELKEQGRRMSGFGHRIHTEDPRTARLFELAEAAGVVGDHVRAARAIESAFRASGRPLPINVDGAMGALLADLGFEPAIMNGVFMIARVPGLVAHVHEEHSRERPMRKIDPVNHTYDGPADRHL